MKEIMPRPMTIKLLKIRYKKKILKATRKKKGMLHPQVKR